MYFVSIIWSCSLYFLRWIPSYNNRNLSGIISVLIYLKNDTISQRILSPGAKSGRQQWSLSREPCQTGCCKLIPWSGSHIVIQIQCHSRRRQKLLLVVVGSPLSPTVFNVLIHWGGKSMDMSSLKLILSQCGGLG